ncbi:MAG: YceI family protein [Planctomycetota bacterium]
MKILHICLIAAFATACSSVSAGEDMTLVTSESSIKFLGTKPDGTKQPGGFKKFEVKANADFEDPNASTISIEIDVKSIFSKDKKLTNHLMSPDFFDVRKYPKITFESTDVEINADHTVAKITGQWKMLGKAVEIEIPTQCTPTGQGLDMVASFKIDRTKWGMDYGKGKIDDDVKVDVKFVLKR